MCGVVGYVGTRKAIPVLLDTLQRVLYRGYDSFGVAVLNGSGIEVYKQIGTLEDGLKAVPDLHGRLGIGHTRWATVGKVCRENAHPHLDCTGNVAVVHNGDIDNYHMLRAQLTSQGHHFRSETDSEVVAHLVEVQGGASLVEKVQRTTEILQGSYALVVLHSSAKELVVARRDSPLIIGIGENETFVASDVPAVLPYTDKVIYLEDGDLARVTPAGAEVWEGVCHVARKVHQVAWEPGQLDRGGFEHYMLKEIHEQPQALRDTITPHLDQGIVHEGLFGGFGMPSRVLFLGCGTSYHAGLLGKELLEDLLPIDIEAQVASEYTGKSVPAKDALAIVLSQSGETADTISALRKVKREGYRTLAITNVVGSSVTRLTDNVFVTQAGPEVAVAATKTFLSQLGALYVLGEALRRQSHNVDESFTRHLHTLPNQIRSLLSDTLPFERMGYELAHHESLFLVARGLNFPIALEGALKLKEVAYVHAEGCAAGELKHGPFALLGPDVPVIALVANDEHRLRMMTAIREIKARGSRVIAVAAREDSDLHSFVDDLLTVPATHPLLTPVLNSVAVQLLSYYCARARQCPIDRPRNLAKSVTVP